MKKIILLLFLPSILFSQNTKPAIAVLGITHSGQLASPAQQPAALRAFIHRVKPDAILIERSPEEFARSDFYEFTYEQQFVVVPFARQQKIPLYPIDWLPKEEDPLLALGVKDLEVPAFTRNPSGFWGFMNFTDSSILQQSLYYAEDSVSRWEMVNWYTPYPFKQTNADFPRRLFLYRTFLQAKRIDAAAKNFTQNDTLLVVIGSLHKDDIERNLSAAGYTILNTAGFGMITDAELKNNYELKDAFAIASFNLLGVQSRTTIIDRNLLADAMKYLKTVNSPETVFFNIKYQLFNKTIHSDEAIDQYLAILKTLPKTTVFTWTGVKSRSRIDSYFDPFGNMTLWQRIHLELAREYFKSGNINSYNKEKELLLNEFQGMKKAMLQAYWPDYIEK
jgi:hypothetical protein